MEINMENSIRQLLIYTEREENAQTAMILFREFIDCVKSSTHVQIIHALENVAWDFSLENELCPECNCRLIGYTTSNNDIKCPKCLRSY